MNELMTEKDVLTRVEERFPVYDMQVYTDPTHMTMNFRGKIDLFDEPHRFGINVSERELIHDEYAAIETVYRELDGFIRGLGEQHYGLFCEVPIEISDVGGYKITCHACNEEASLSHSFIKLNNVSRKKAFAHCLRNLHSYSQIDDTLPCRNIYIP